MKTHGHKGASYESPTHSSWRSMKLRCNNKNQKAFRIYGGRGIKICERWDKFENFLCDMGERPSSHHYIDRIDNNGNYCAENCRWATRIQQARNKRNNLVLVVNGRKKTVADWADEIGVKAKTIKARLRRGDSPQEAIRSYVMTSRESFLCAGRVRHRIEAAIDAETLIKAWPR